MTTICKGFKVCATNSEGTRFFSMSLVAERVEFIKHVSVRRPKFCGPITVFRTQRHARKFMGKIGWTLVLFSCEFEPSEDNEVWSNENEYARRHPLSALPTGTRLADSVKLIKRLDLWL